MAIPPGERQPRLLEDIAQEVIERYQALFDKDVRPGVIEQAPNPVNTQRIITAFLQSLPEDPKERDRILSACASGDPLLTALEGAYAAYMAATQWKPDSI